MEKRCPFELRPWEWQKVALAETLGQLTPTPTSGFPWPQWFKKQSSTLRTSQGVNYGQVSLGDPLRDIGRP